MENIRQAIERAKAGSSFQRRPTLAPATDLDQQSRYSGAQHFDAQPEAQEIELNSAHLQAHRIISYGTSNPLSRPFDMLRTQVLQTMDAKGWKVLAVTSPTAACGKTVTAVNLALSIARSPEKISPLLRIWICRGQNFRSALGYRPTLEFSACCGVRRCSLTRSRTRTLATSVWVFYQPERHPDRPNCCRPAQWGIYFRIFAAGFTAKP